jgi:alkylation response protein AidB-like acyl-CoA dehydrogenase
MDFNFTEEQEMLRTSARNFLSKECPKTKIREFEESEKEHDPDMWKKMADLGWMGLVFPEEYGGSEGEFMDLIVLLEEMGYNILPGPFFSSVILCGFPIRDFGTEEQRKEFVPQIARGEMIMALALTEPDARYDASGIKLQAVLKDDNYTLNGTKLFVHDAHVADYLLVATRTSEGKNPEEGITLFLVKAKSPGIGYTVLKTIASDNQCEVTFNDVKIPRTGMLGKLNQGWEIIERVLEKAAVAECALMVGGAQAVLEMTNSYAKERVQFGRPIGSFQVIQHKLVDMMTSVDGARNLTYEAAWKINEGLPCALEASMAKARVNEAYQRVCIDGMIIHATIAFTWDHDMGLYFRRAKAAEIAFGDADFHRERVAQELGL